MDSVRLSRQATMMAVLAATLTPGIPEAQVVQQGADSMIAAPTTLLAPSSATEDLLDPLSPLDSMPGLAVDWPEIADIATPDPTPIEMGGTSMLPPEPGVPLEVHSTTESTAPIGTTSEPSERVTSYDNQAEARYLVSLEGTEGMEAADLASRFKALSLLHQYAGQPANIAQIDRRAREDTALLQTLLRSYGYYDAEVDMRLSNSGSGNVVVSLAVSPGSLYRFTSVEVVGLDQTDPRMLSLRTSFAVKTGDPVDATKLEESLAALRSTLGRNGYAFAEVREPDVEIDHAETSGTMVVTVVDGGRHYVGQIILKGPKLFSARHIGRVARFKSGDRYDAADMEDLRRALIATGLVSTAVIKPVRSTDQERVDIEVNLTPGPLRTIAGELGYGTGEGARAEVSWQHRNLLPPEGAVTFRGVAGTQEQLLGAVLRRGNFKRRDQVLNANFSASHIDRTAYKARTVAVGAGLERQTNLIWQKKWTWSYGGEFITSDETDNDADTGESRRRTYMIASAPLSLAYDGSDNLLDPTNGFRLSARVSPEVSFLNQRTAYVRAQFDGSGYFPVAKKIVLAGRVRLGMIAGAGRSDLAPSRRFYAGGGGSVRGYGYQKIGPEDVFGDPVGGKSLAEFAVEARIRFGDFGIVPFLDAGNLYESGQPTFRSLRYGAGIGVRYYTNFGPIRVDLGTPLNRRSGESRIGLYVSLGQAF